MTSTLPDGSPSLGATQKPGLSSLLSSPNNPLPDPLAIIAEEQLKVKWASYVENEFVKCKWQRVPFERQWYINLAFVQGKQYIAPIEVANQGFRLTTPKSPPWKVRLVINKVRTAVRRECAKLTSGKPIPVVVPASTDEEDYTAARVAEQLLKHAFSRAEFEQEFRSFVWWGVTTGTAFLKSYWDPSAIDYESSDQTAQPNPDSPHLPPMPPQPVRGKIVIERVTPFHIYVPDMLAEDINKQPYIIHATTRSVESLSKLFPGEKFTADAKASNTIMESAVLMTKGSQEHLDSVLVKEMWIKPGSHPDFPEGGVLTVANSKVIQCVKKWPYPFPDYPFYKYNGIPTGGFYCDSVLVDLIPIQKEYNRKKSQSIEIMNLMGKPKFIYAKGSVNPRQISSEPGQGIPYVAGFPKPEAMQGVEVPASFSNELDRLAQDFDDISGQHEISRGNTPPQVTSGTAIAFLQEQDDTMLSYQVASIEHCIERLGRHYLKFVLTYWDEARMIKITGKDGAFEVRHWKGSDLRGNTDVQVQAGSGLPNSKAARTALVTEFMTNGWIEPAVGLEMLQMGGMDKVVDEMLVDKRQVQRENLKMAELDPQLSAQAMNPPPGPDGQPLMGPDGMTPMNPDGTPFQPQPTIKVNSWDDHEMHIMYHNQFRKTQQFEQLPDEIKQEFELHVQTHQMSIQLPQVGAGGNVVNPGMQAGMEEEPPPEEEAPPSGPPSA